MTRIQYPYRLTPLGQWLYERLGIPDLAQMFINSPPEHRALIKPALANSLFRTEYLTGCDSGWRNIDDLPAYNESLKPMRDEARRRLSQSHPQFER